MEDFALRHRAVEGTEARCVQIWTPALGEVAMEKEVGWVCGKTGGEVGLWEVGGQALAMVLPAGILMACVSAMSHNLVGSTQKVPPLAVF